MTCITQDSPRSLGLYRHRIYEPQAQINSLPGGQTITAEFLRIDLRLAIKILRLDPGALTPSKWHLFSPCYKASGCMLNVDYFKYKIGGEW
ncbi:hypothetical protein LTS15_004733 [Exophiala xenobiotica]|nr:hypothetical protein LTS15_004733 [Exophiala xenobiotica]